MAIRALSKQELDRFGSPSWTLARLTDHAIAWFADDAAPISALLQPRSSSVLATDTLRLTVTLHGVARSFDVPTTIERDRTTLTASGELRMLQSEFGITPMSVMGGAMTVQDPMELKFRIVAKAHAGKR